MRMVVPQGDYIHMLRMNMMSITMITGEKRAMFFRKCQVSDDVLDAPQFDLNNIFLCIFQWQTAILVLAVDSH